MAPSTKRVCCLQAPSSPLGQLGILPLETRQQIYSYYLQDIIICKSISPINAQTPDLWTPQPLIYASKTIHNEVVTTLYDNKIFKLEIHVLNVDRFIPQKETRFPTISNMPEKITHSLYPPLRQLSNISVFHAFNLSRIKNIEIKLAFGKHTIESLTSNSQFTSLAGYDVRHFQAASKRIIDRGREDDANVIDIDDVVTKILKPLTGPSPQKRHAAMIIQTHTHPSPWRRSAGRVSAYCAPDACFTTNTIARTVSRFNGFNTVTVELQSCDTYRRKPRDCVCCGRLRQDFEMVGAGIDVMRATPTAWFLGLGPAVLEIKSEDGYEIVYDGRRTKTSKEATVTFRPVRELERRRKRAQQAQQTAKEALEAATTS